jgi:hypothetical protein
LKNFNRWRWLSSILIFILLILFWTSLAAATAPRNHETVIVQSSIQGLVNPQSATFGIIIGAIVLVTIVITSAILRKPERG